MKASGLGRRDRNRFRSLDFPYEVGVEPVHVNVERMVSHYRQGLTDLEPIWQQILADDTFTQLRDLKGTSGTDCRHPR